jgi:hypothetical protein
LRAVSGLAAHREPGTARVHRMRVGRLTGG